MKIMLIVETPDDDELHYPRIAKALTDYIRQVAFNHSMAKCGFPHVEYNLPQTTKLGSDLTTPNTFVASNGVIVTEERIK